MADLQAKAILSAEDRASAVLAMVARNFDRLNKAADAMHTRDSRVKQADAFNATLERRAAAMAALSKAYSLADRGVGMIPGMYASGGLAIAPLVAAAAWVKASKATAEYERAYTRIGITGESTKAQQDQAALDVERLAQQTAMSMKDIRAGLEALVASGRSVPEAMSFLPSVAKTAQAAGAGVDDIAKSADAASKHLKITSVEMQNAFDVMAAGGKAGKFELKDMARYMPSFMPAGKLAGFSGLEGLQKMVAMLQIIRDGSGTAEEAASSFNNILSKFESEKTVKELGEKFEELGMKSDVVEKRFEQARKSGGNLVEVFIDLIKQATKGDYSKINKIIDDQEFKRGTIALLTMEGQFRSLENKLRSVSGTVDNDFNRVLKDSQSNFDRLSASASRAWINIGKTAPVQATLKKLNEAVETLNTSMERTAEMQRMLDERASRPIPAAKPAQQIEAEGILEALRLANNPGPSRKGVYDAPAVPAKGKFAKEVNAAEAAFAARREAIAAKEREERQQKARRDRNVPARAGEAEEIASGSGPSAEALAIAEALNAQDRAGGATHRSLEEMRKAAEKEIADALAGGIKLPPTGPDKYPPLNGGGMRNLLSNSIDDALFNARIREAIRAKEEADRRQGGNNVSATPAEVNNRVNKEGFGPVTAKVDGKVEVGTTVRVEASPDFITSIVSRVKSAIGPVFGTTGTADGTSQP